MKQDRTYRLMALLMVTLMLVSSVGLNIDMHYCKGELKTFNLFGKAKNCHEIAMNGHCKAKKSCHAPVQKAESDCKKDCCNNKTVYAEFDADLIPPILQTTPHHPLSFIIPQPIYLTSLSVDLHTFTHFQNYRPPPLIKDIPVLIQSFLL